ncbi:MAG: UDP-4-amino-4,6-dideoxy-N-acetyl-beta-L-altrosamine transaminase [Bacteroidota bacterium]
MKIPYGKQHITEADKAAVLETLDHDFLTQGPKIAEFEAAFADYVKADYASAVANGTAALHLCTVALGVTRNTNVITSPITFSASANCVRYCGGTVWFADIDPKTGLLDLEAVRELIERKPAGFFSGIIPVDFAGMPVNMETFRELADEHGLWLIEDSCHAPGGFFKDSKGKKQHCGSGAYADLAIFSFHPVKHIACGEGGMITTRRKDLFDKIQILRTDGITRDPERLLDESHGGWYYEMQDLGYNYRLSDIQASLGLSQLQRADENLKKRHEIARRYAKAFEKTSIQPLTPYDKGNAYHLYVILTEKRKGLYDYLRENGIFAQVHYIPVHLMPYYEKHGFRQGDFPEAERYYAQCLSLPMYPTLSKEEQEYVIEKVMIWSKNA